MHKKIISSGNSELDSRMGGGIPAETLILIEGSSGAGKSVLSQQLIWGALLDHFRVSLFTSENSVKSLIRQMQSIDLDVLDFLLMNKLRIYPIKLSWLGDAAPMALFDAMVEESNKDVLVIDSFTSAISSTIDDTKVLRFFEGCQKLCERGQTIMVTLHSGSINSELMNNVRSMCDAHLKLRTEQDGQRLVKTLEVAKIRGAASVTGAIVGFDVEPGWGVRVIPISKARG